MPCVSVTSYRTEPLEDDNAPDVHGTTAVYDIPLLLPSSLDRSEPVIEQIDLYSLPQRGYTIDCIGFRNCSFNYYSTVVHDKIHYKSSP